MKTPNSGNNLVYSYKVLYYQNNLETLRKISKQKVGKRIIVLSSVKTKSLLECVVMIYLIYLISEHENCIENSH